MDKAPAEMRFRRAGNRLEIINPTPYYITLTDIKAGDISLDGVMVAPVSTATVSLPAASGSRITFGPINDYGAVSAPVIARFFIIEAGMLKYLLRQPLLNASVMCAVSLPASARLHFDPSMLSGDPVAVADLSLSSGGSQLGSLSG